MAARKAARVLSSGFAVLLLGTVACGSSMEAAEAESSDGASSQGTDASGLPAVEDFGVPGQEGCEPASPVVDGEARGTPRSTGDSAFGLLMGPFRDSTLLAGEEPFKIVTRVTGSGALEVRILDPAGKGRELDWGPEDHFGASNYARPGDEWGIGVVFDQPGCWRIEMIRDEGAIADFWLAVTDS